MQIKWNKVPYFIANSEIIYIERNHRNTIIHTPDQTYRSTATLDELTTQLDSNFVRCHKSYIVRIDCIRSATFTTITLKDGLNIPVSRSHHSQIKDVLSNSQKGM